MTYRLGALPPQRPYGLATLSAYATGPLPAPPAKVTVPSVATWGMMDNDRLGCCTVSGVGHAVLAWNAEVAGNDAIPSDAEVEKTYFELTGGSDAGCVEAAVLAEWHATGLFGHRIAGYAPVEPHDHLGLLQSIYLFGAAYLGVALPASAQEQFAAGHAWTVVPGSPIEGGHCILAVGYDQNYVQVISWGKVVNVSYPWLAAYMTECWAIISHQFEAAGHDGVGVNITALQTDLARL